MAELEAPKRSLVQSLPKETAEESRPTAPARDSFGTELTLPKLGFPSLAAAGLDLGTFTLPSLGRPAIKLSPEARADILNNLSPKEQNNFLREEKLVELGEHLKPKELSLLRHANLTLPELDKALEETRLSSFGSLGSGDRGDRQRARELTKLTPLEQSQVDKLSKRELVGALASMSPDEQKALDPAIEQRAMARLADDPNAILHIQQSRFKTERLDPAQTAYRGALRNALASQTSHATSIMPEFLSNRTSGFRLETDGFRERYQDARQVRTAAEGVLDKSTAERTVGNLLQHVAGGAPPGRAEELRGRAAELFTQSSLTLHETSLPSLNPEAGMQKIRDAGQLFENSATNWDRGVRTLTTVRNGAVVIVAAGAATLAAPAIFAVGAAASGSAAIGFVGSVVGGAAIGGGTGLAYGGLTTSIENTGHALVGNKTSTEAFNDALRQTRADGYNGAIAGAGSGAAGALAKILNPGSQQLASWIVLRNGATQAGTASAVSFSADTTTKVVQARSEFSEKFKDSKLSEEQLGAEYGKFMKAQGLDWKTLSQQGGMNLVMSSFFGASGARFELARNAPGNAGLGRQAAIETSEWSLNTLAGFGKAYFDTPAEQRTFDNLLQAGVDQVASNTVSSFQGRAASTVRLDESAPDPIPASVPAPAPNPTPTLAPARNPSPEIATQARPPIIGRDAPVSTETDRPPPTHQQPNIAATDQRVPPGGLASLLLPPRPPRSEPEPATANRISPSPAAPELVGAGVTQNDPHAMATDPLSGNKLTTTDTTAGPPNDNVPSEDTVVRTGSGKNKDIPNDETTQANPPTLEPGRALTDNQLLSRMDTFLANSAPLSVKQQLEMVNDLKLQGLYEDFAATIPSDQLTRLEASHLAATAFAGKSETLADGFSENLTRLANQSGISIIDVGKQFGKTDPTIVGARIARAAALSDQGVTIEGRDVRPGSSADDRMEWAKKQLRDGKSAAEVNKQLIDRRYIERKIGELQLGNEAQFELELSLNRLMANPKFMEKHSMEEVFKVIKDNPQGGREFILDLGILSKAGIDGVDRVFESVNKIQKGQSTGDTRGFFEEARIAVKLREQGHQVEQLSATSFGGRELRDQWGQPREIDIIVRKSDGQVEFVEVKGSTEAFLQKNSGDPERSQLVVQARLAKENGAENKVIIAEAGDLNRKIGRNEKTQRARIEKLLTDSVIRGLLRNPPHIMEGSGERIL